MGWLIAAAVLLVIIWLPVGVRVRYNSEGPRVQILAGPVKILLWPRKKKIKKKDPEKKKSKPAGQKKPAAKPSAEEKTPEKGGSVTDFLPFVRLALDFLKDLRRKLRVRKLELKLILAGGDPCDLAVNYGKTCAAVGNFLPLLEQFLKIGSRDINIECDFAADQTVVIAGADITITIGRICGLGVRYGIRAVRELIKFKNKRKGGAVK